MKQATDSSFETTVLKAPGLTIVDFWAEWCGPCRQLAPHLDAVSQERSDIEIVKLNVDENPDTPVKYGVRGIPTLIAFKGGEAVAVKPGGNLNKTKLLEWIDSLN